MVNELQTMYEAGWRGQIFFVDDNFIGNKKKLKAEVCRPSANGARTSVSRAFMTEVSINLADDEELMEMMVDAGFDSVFVGIESPNEDSLAECGKGQNRQRNLIECVQRIQQRGMQVAGGFIIGFDSDPLSIFQQQIEFIQKSGIVTAMVGLLQAPPGTELYERLRKEGRILGDHHGEATPTTR